MLKEKQIGFLVKLFACKKVCINLVHGISWFLNFIRNFLRLMALCMDFNLANRSSEQKFIIKAIYEKQENTPNPLEGEYLSITHRNSKGFYTLSCNICIIMEWLDKIEAKGFWIVAISKHLSSSSLLLRVSSEGT